MIRSRYRLATALVRMLVTAALALTLAPAQERTLRLQNLTPYPRQEVVAIAVPFAEGAVATLPDLHIAEHATVWQPFGARWPDGSLRQALCLFAYELGAQGHAEVALVQGPGPKLPSGEITMPTGELEFVAVVKGERHRAVPARVRDLEANALRRVELRRARLGATGLVVELIVTACRDQPHAYVDLAVFFSDPRTEAMQVGVDELTVMARGGFLVCRHGPWHGVTQHATADGSRVVLLQDRVIGDGQGLRRCAALLPPLTGDGSLTDTSSQAACIAPLLGATTWRGSGAFGAFGVIPELPPWLRGNRLQGHLALRHRVYTSKAAEPHDPFHRPPLILAKFAGQTGSQDDFGAVKMTLVAHSGLPSMLHEAEGCVVQEACRPVHYYEPDGSRVDPAEHPDWVVWSGRTHWHKGVSPDRLGKPHPQPKYDSHGWTGKDRQHWSSNHLGAFALLTGAHWARRELEHEIILYLSGQTVRKGWSTSNPGAPRGAGRTLQAASWMYLATGDARLLRRINERLDRIHSKQWAGRTLGPGKVRCMAFFDPDPRALQGKSKFWVPWQEALAVTGYAAAYYVTGNENARELAELLALNTTRYGWRFDDKDCALACFMRWQDGRPLTHAEYSNPLAVHWSHSFNDWGIASLEIARHAARSRGDEALARRAEAIQKRVRAGRRRPKADGPRLGGLDPLTEWDAVRWQ